HKYVKNSAGEQKQNDGENQHENKNNTITDKSTKDNKRFITEKVEEKPSGYENE
ncbi:hypothetical protein A2U01_0112444, partial [Trifolium medium]|nr:hypothetical protein [Trifolium medium]